MDETMFGFGTAAAILFGVSVDATLTVFGATNSSPQTTHLFARDRADTLMWYVRAGLFLSVAVVAVMAMGAFRDGGWKLAVWPVAGGVLAGGGMWWLYQHALTAGGGKTQAPAPAGRAAERSYAAM